MEIGSQTCPGANKFMSSSGLDNAKGATKLAEQEKGIRFFSSGKGKGAGKGKRRSAHYTQFAVRCEHINFV